MKLVLALASVITFSGAAHALPKEIRVRVQRGKSAVEVSGFGLKIAPPGNLLSVSIPELNLTKAKISRTKKGQWIVKWPGTKESARFDSSTLAVRGQMLRLGLEPVPYDLEVLPNPKTGMDVIATLDLETYLAGVLPSEMPAAWPIEALKAQAVAARSFVLKTALERRNRHYDVDSTIMDQVYKFLDHAKDHPEWRQKIARAIQDTRGEVLRDDRNRLVKAFYSADCGCVTEDPKFVWGRVDSIQSVTDPTCTKRKTRQWNLNLSKIEAREKLVASLGLPATSSLRTIQIAGRTPSGRVAAVIASLNIEGKTQNFWMNSQEFRKIFGFEKIRSTDFKLRWLGDNVQILGSGMGHAVGLCQTGAKALAESGMSYREILKLYYPKTTLYRDKPGRPASPRQNTVRPRSAEPA